MTIQNRLFLYLIMLGGCFSTAALAQVGAGAITIDTLRIVSPAGATDAVLSTEQHFRFEAEIEFTNADDIQAQIFLPEGFAVVGGSDVQNINEPGPRATATWLLQAANRETSGFIRVEVTGKDDRVILPGTISAVPDSLFVTVVRKAQLAFRAEITAPVSATDRDLTVNQAFTIAATLENLGDAAVLGEDSVKITLPPGYETTESLTKSLQARPLGIVAWRVKAPATPTGVSDIVLQLLPFSVDENTNEIPAADQNRLVISVTTSPIGLITNLRADRKKAAAVRGSNNVPLLGLQFENDADSDISITGVTFRIKNRAGEDIDGKALFSRLAIVDFFSPERPYAEFTLLSDTAGPIRLELHPVFTIPALASAALELRGDILQEPATSNFQIVIVQPQQDIDAVDDSGNAVVILDNSKRERSHTLSSGLFQLVDVDVQMSFYNYPNPFTPSQQFYTNFIYNLEQPSDVTLSIYTLLGELVWTKSYKATETPGLAGLHDRDILWDGKNAKGEDVLNGVYIAVLRTSQGTAMTKIALAK